MKKYKAFIAVFVTLALIFSSFSPVSAVKDTSKQGGVFYEASFSDPINLNPALSSDSASSDVTSLMFRGLLKRDWNSNLVPDVAASMPTISKDNKTITFKLRKDVKWHDGKPFTSADVKFSYEFILDKKVASPRYTNFEKIDSIEAPDPYTVIFKLKEPDSALLPNFNFAYIIPKHIWENVDRTKARESEYNKSKPIGNGPFKFVEWKPAERVVLAAFEDFYEGRPNFDQYIFKITPSQAVAMVKVETGEANIVMVPESDIARMKSKSNLNTIVYDRAAFDCILYNIKSPFFSDKRVRQALSYAVNKQAIVNGIYKGIGKPAVGSYNPKFWAYSPDVTMYNYDVVKAKKLLDEAGWIVNPKTGIREKDGVPFKFVMLTNKGNIMREKLLVVLQSQFRAVGIQVEPRILEWNTFLNKYVDVGKFDAYVGGFTTSIDGDQTTFYHSKPEMGYLNKGRYSNSRVDKILEDAKKTFDINEQKKLYAELQKIVSDDQPMTFLVYRRQGISVSKNVKDVKIVDILGSNGHVNDWYMEK